MIMKITRRTSHRSREQLAALLIALVASAVLASGCGTDDPLAAAETTDAASEATSAGVVVTPGRASWSTGYFQAAIYSALLEELGYTVAAPSVNEYPPSEAYGVMAEGAIDFWANGWYPQHDIWLDETLGDGTRIGDNLVVIGDQLEDAGLQGLVVTKSVADGHDVTSLAQINDDPELVALFDIDGNGAADILGCPDEWTCDNVIDEMINLSGWTNLEQLKAGYEGMFAATLDRVNADEPAILYTWSPSGYLAELTPGENVLWLSMGGQENVLDGSTESELDYAQYGPGSLGATCSADPCWPGWAVEDIRVTANQEFADANPSAVALFEVVKIAVIDIAAQNARYDAGENSEADLRREAQEWIAANRAQVDEWLSFALAAAG